MAKALLGFLCCFLFVVCLQTYVVPPVYAGEEEQRVKLLQEKMAKLKELLAKLEEAKLRQKPPTEIPWQAILKMGEERIAYDQYAYLLAPQMPALDLDSALQQLNYLANQDEMKERGTLYVIPALPLKKGESMSVKSYNRDLAGELLQKLGLPSSMEGGLLVTPYPVLRLKQEAKGDPLLFIDLTGCDQIMRARIFGTLKTTRMYSEDGSVHQYLWNLLKSTAPQSFTVYIEDGILWLSLAQD